ncbi:MAG: hypothetical protein WCC25_16785, partial [Candidatus Korobacteraceae bacterium]
MPVLVDMGRPILSIAWYARKMKPIVSIRKMRPLEPAGSAGTVMTDFAAVLFAALTGLAALETV